MWKGIEGGYPPLSTPLILRSATDYTLDVNAQDDTQ